MARVVLRVVDPATPLLILFSVLRGDGDRALRGPPEALTIREVGLPRERHLFSEASRRLPRVDAKLLSQVTLRVVGADSRDVVGTLDAREEWAADARFEGGFVQRVRLTVNWDLLERRRLRLGARPVVRVVAERPVLKM